MSSWKIGKKLREANPFSSSSTLSTNGNGTESQSRSTTPTPSNPGSDAAPLAVPRSGLLTIRITSARNLTLPSPLPAAVQKAVSSQVAQVAASVSPSSVTQQRAQKGHKSRDSVQRQKMWWLPYLVVQFDVNQVVIDALGGELENPVWMYHAHFDVSRSSEIAIHVYLRTGPTSGNASAGTDMGNDQFLGSYKITPDFETLGTADEWHDVSGGSGQIQMGFSYRPHTNQSLTIDSFELLKVIGKGSFGKVMQVRKRDTGRIYALKTIRKAHIAEKGEVTHTLHERLVLTQVSSPFIVPLKFSFQSEAKLYLVLAFVNGGELFHHLQKEQRFSEERARFYAAELLLALQHLHEHDIVYRDLKPENILLDYTGHINLCDFGLCKINMTESDTTQTFCGTPEYLSPEILLSAGYNKSVDWWTLGVLLYEMLSGLPPFYDENTNEMYRKILQDPLRFGDEIGADARNILTGLLTRDPSRRLGANGADEIKKHPFFAKHIDFKKLLAKKIQPPFKPSVQSAIDCSNFDDVFTSEAPQDSVVEGSHLSETVQAQFAGFSYEANNDLSQSPSVRS